ncbi:DUF1778 domain-containing protein [Sphingomonas crocodyli]|uniref:DUF1778 domain-containing protein n=1 Tax=Sphingomonas crocodyli TaxID=1979270 RepID=A0A437LYY4_9SPHN|nr:DUF1778 domain-containing protein [Sphingomonas crocodyli]RVT90524.1 DUF1778 domain-containing protein [Sphingomonas crocodyli]
MLTFDDYAGQVPERGTERMNFRTKPHIERSIQRAARLAVVDGTVFTISAAYSPRSRQSRRKRTELQAADYDAFLAALDNPPEPNDRLRNAAEHYHETISLR